MVLDCSLVVYIEQSPTTNNGICAKEWSLYLSPTAKKVRKLRKVILCAYVIPLWIKRSVEDESFII